MLGYCPRSHCLGGRHGCQNVWLDDNMRHRLSNEMLDNLVDLLANLDSFLFIQEMNDSR